MMSRYFLALVFSFCFFSLHAQDGPVLNAAQPPKAKLQLQSPRSVVETHLLYLQSDSYEPEVSAHTFQVADAEKGKDLAIKLKQILDSEGLFVDLDVIPDEENYVDSATGLHRYVLFQEFPAIYVERVNGKWYYSKRTAEAIPEMYDKLFTGVTELLIGIFPSVGNKDFGGLKVWQIWGILIYCLVAVILHKLLTLLLEGLINQLGKRFTHLEGQVEIVRSIARPLSIMVITLLLIYFVPSLMLPVKVAKFIMTALKILTPVFGTIAMYKLVDLISFYMERMASHTDTTLDDQLVPLVRKSLKIFVIIIGILIILNNLNVNVAALLAGISIGGFALALAAQDTIKNLFGSLMIFIDRPFQIGDAVQFDGQAGTVEEVGFRSTRVRTFANSLVSVPNGRIADMTIDNLGMRVYRRFNTSITITYDTPTVVINAYVEGLRKLVEQHPLTRKDAFEIHLNNMGPHSLDILFYIFFAVPDWSSELKARHEIIMSAIELAEELGVRFAFPTQTLHIEEMPGQESLTPKSVTDPEELRNRVAAYLERKASDYKS